MAVEYYDRADGSIPMEEWLNGLTDQETVGRILVRISRLGRGHVGDSKPVGEGVWELRLDFGPGFRIYYATVGRRVLLLLCGGSKKSQKRDIKTAKVYFGNYKARKQ